MNRENEMSITFDSRSENEGLARVVVAAFMAPMDPTMEELSDVKTAVSEAVTNAIIHGYEGGQGKVTLRGKICHNRIELQVEDQGVGIPDVEKAMEPLFTTRPELDRSGMGFAFMEAFMDELAVESGEGKGTLVRMKKTISSAYDGR